MHGRIHEYLLVYLIIQAHIAIADCESRLKKQGRHVVVITQNIDELHARAGTKNILELHGMNYLSVLTLMIYQLYKCDMRLISCTSRKDFSSLILLQAIYLEFDARHVEL